MSKVYSFRLDENNPRETQAREVIDAWVSKGYSLRQVLVDSLIQYENNGKQYKDLYLLLKQLWELINQDTNRKMPVESEDEATIALSPSFLEGIRKSIKSGEEAE